MNKKTAGTTCFAILCVAIFLIWNRYGSSRWGAILNQADVPSKLTDNLNSPRIEDSRRRASPKIKDPRLKRYFDGVIITDNIINANQINRYFDAVGRNERSLAVIFRLTGDRAYINELRTISDSPFSLSMGANFGGDPKMAEEDAARLAELDPTNPTGHFLSAYWKAKNGDAVSAMEALDAILELPQKIRNDSPESDKEALDSLKIMGMDNVEANVYLWKHAFSYRISRERMHSMINRVIQSKDISEEQRADRATKLLGLCLTDFDFSGSHPGASRDQFILESLVLSNLPRDYEYGEGKTVNDRLIEIRKLDEVEVDLIKSTIPALKGASPETVDILVQKVEEDGWLSGRAWLLKQRSSE